MRTRVRFLELSKSQVVTGACHHDRTEERVDGSVDPGLTGQPDQPALNTVGNERLKSQGGPLLRDIMMVLSGLHMDVQTKLS